MPNSADDFLLRLQGPRPVLLDGATGTELERRGIPTELPLWSTIALFSKDGRDTLKAIHQDYISAGAEIVTANTFRTNPYTLKKANRGEVPATLTRIAVDIARSAIDSTHSDHRVFLAGSVAPTEDCYHPERVPPEEVFRDDLRRHIDHLFASDVDVYLIETMNTIREVAFSTSYAVQTGKPVLVSLLVKNAEQLLGGESMADTISVLNPLKPAAVLLNCIGLELLEVALGKLQELATGPTGCYANVVHDTVDAEQFAGRMQMLTKRYQLKIIGGCCGTTPEHIFALKNLI